MSQRYYESYARVESLLLVPLHEPRLQWNETNESTTTNFVVPNHVTAAPRTQQFDWTAMHLFYAAGVLLWSYLIFVVLAPRPRCDCKRRLDGKIVIITGGTDGVGKATVLELASRGATIILPCRNLAKGKNVIAEIEAATGNSKLSLYYVDFMDLDSVQSCAEKIRKSIPKIDILINNAGIGSGVGETRDGFPLLFGVNHLAPFLFTTRLLEKLRRAEKARIIFVSSIAHLWGEINFDKLQELDNGSVQSQFRAYSRSKLANVLFAKQLHRMEVKHGITTYVAHPGWTFTSIFRDFPRLLKIFVFPIFHLFLYLPEEGAQTQIHLALASGLEHESGEYFVSCSKAETCRNALDSQLAKDLWIYSEKAVTSALSADVPMCISI